MVVGELLHAIGATVVEDPLTFLAEVVQFAILVGVGWLVAFGLGKREGLVTKMLRQRRETVESDLSEVDQAKARVTELREEARRVEAVAQKEGRRAGVVAKRDAKEMLAAERESADQEAAAIVTRAEQMLEHENEEMLAETRHRLLEVVAGATRRVLGESMSPVEQRSAVQQAVLRAAGDGGDAAGHAVVA